MVPLGVSIGAATRIGNLIGQGDGAGLRRAVRAALTFGASIMVFAASAFTLLRFQLPRVYTHDALLIPLAAQILPVAGAFQLADGTQAVAGGILRGMGRPHIAALANLLGYYVLALPLAYLLGLSLRARPARHLARTGGRPACNRGCFTLVDTAHVAHGRRGSAGAGETHEH